MLSTTATLLTYEKVCPQVIAWAAARELVSDDGSPLRANPLSQHGKTVEEVGEAADALEALRVSRAKDRTPGYIDCDRKDLALELGDILVTLTIQSGMHGKTLEQCRAESGRLITGYGSDWKLGKASHPPMTSEYVGEWATLLGDALTNLDSPYRFDIAGLIGAITTCVEDVARIELCLLGAECLALALAKIEGRQGEVIDGVFVKAEGV